MNWRTAKIIFLLLLCFWCSTRAQQLNIKNYSVGEGLSQSQVLNVSQDHAGIIWFCTSGGISLFDGLKFVNISTRDGLRSNKVYVAHEDKNKIVWIGTSKGVAKYQGKKISILNDPLINDRSVYSIHEHSNGELWFGTSTGIVIYDGKTFRSFEKNDMIGNFQIWVIRQDHLGNVWIGTMFNGVFLYDGNKVVHFDESNGLIDQKNRDILISGDKVWIATFHGINIYDLSKGYTGNLKLDTLKVNGKPYRESVLRLCKDSRDMIWAGTQNGVDRISINNIRSITTANGLCNDKIQGLIQDKEGNMWFGSASGGISKYRNDLFININETHGLANNNVMAFLRDSKDNVWIGTWGGGVSKIDLSAFRDSGELKIQNYGEKKEEAGLNNVWSICEDKKGNIWFGTSGAGITVYDGKKFRLYHLKDGLHGIRIISMVCDKKGNIWIAHENGLDMFDGVAFKSFSSNLGFETEGVSAIYEDNFGQIWLGSSDKIVKYDDGSFITITRPGGFPKIRNIINDKFGYMWLSTEAGVFVYNGSSFKSISEKDGLCSNTVNYIRPDENGDLWMGTNNGVDKLDLNLFVNQKDIVLKHYGKEEGFMGQECNQNAFFKDRDGRLWMGTVGGITIYDPACDRENLVEPITHISAIRLFLEKFNYKRYADSLDDGLPFNLKLPYDKNHVTFDFISISHTNPTKVIYQYMLEGFDPDWLPKGKESTTTYSNLPPGKYVFMVKGCNGDGVWNTAPATYSFEIVPPFWKRPWFYIMSIIIGVGGIFGFIKIRERSLRYSQRLLENQVMIRTSELIQEKEKLQVAYSEIDGKNKDITDSIHYAKRIQNAILPPDTVLKQSLGESFVLYKPKDIVSGDFYWLEKWGNQTFVAAVDCTGHGVPGAFMSIVAHNILTQAVNVLGLTRPALILNETNKQLSRKLNQDPEEATVRDGMDIALIAINYPKMKMEFAGANNPLWIIRDNQLIHISGDKFPIGAFVGEELQQFTNHEFDLRKGDCIYLFTDGFADQFGGPKGKKFKYKQYEDLLMQHHKKPFEEQRNILESTIVEWMGDLEQIDDILIIGIRI